MSPETLRKWLRQARALDGHWYAKYWNPVMAPLPGHIREAIDLGPQATPLSLGLEDAATLTDAGYHDLESGYATFDDGSIHIATLTSMPRVTPAMWDWWFWWHGTSTERYKLWYPRAHVYAEWSGADTAPDALTATGTSAGLAFWLVSFLTCRDATL